MCGCPSAARADPRARAVSGAAGHTRAPRGGWGSDPARQGNLGCGFERKLCARRRGRRRPRARIEPHRDGQGPTASPTRADGFCARGSSGNRAHAVVAGGGCVRIEPDRGGRGDRKPTRGGTVVAVQVASVCVSSFRPAPPRVNDPLYGGRGPTARPHAQTEPPVAVRAACVRRRSGRPFRARNGRTTAAGHPPRPDTPKKTNGRFERQTVSSRDPADCCLGHTHRGTAGPNGKRGDYAKFLPGAWWTRRRSFRNLAEISRPAAVAPAAATRDCRRSSLSGSCAGPTHGPRCATPCVWTCRVTVVDRFGCLCPPAPVQCGGSPDLLRRPAAT